MRVPDTFVLIALHILLKFFSPLKFTDVENRVVFPRVWGERGIVVQRVQNFSFAKMKKGSKVMFHKNVSMLTIIELYT